VTATGTLLPMPTVIKLAGHAYHYLTIFDNDTGRALHLARTRRIASADQRIVLLARDRGCTRPGCTVAGAHCQVHHAVNDWPTTAKPTSTTSPWPVPKTTASVKPGGWKTRKLIDSARLRGVRPGQERLVDPIRAFTPASRRSRGQTPALPAHRRTEQ